MPAPNGCSGGDCSLREAVEAANANCCAQNTILLGAGIYSLSLGKLTYGGILKIVGDSPCEEPSLTMAHLFPG